MEDATHSFKCPGCGQIHYKKNHNGNKDEEDAHSISSASTSSSTPSIIPQQFQQISNNNNNVSNSSSKCSCPACQIGLDTSSMTKKITKSRNGHEIRKETTRHSHAGKKYIVSMNGRRRTRSKHLLSRKSQQLTTHFGNNVNHSSFAHFNGTTVESDNNHTNGSMAIHLQLFGEYFLLIRSILSAILA